MATTQNEHNGNGTLRRFAFTFPYIKEDDVKVQVRTSNADVTDIASNTYTFPSATEIQFSAVTATTFQESTGAPKTGVTVRIFRDTDLDTERVTFFPGSSIRAQDLNDNTLQNLYASQERQNRAVDSTGGTMTGDLLMLQSDIRFEGATADDFETTLTVTDPTADRTITFPDRTGNVILSSDTNTVTSTMVDSSLVDANIAANAEIAVSKLADGNARQVLQTAADGTTVEFTDNVDLPGTLDVTGAATFDSTVTATTFSGNATSASVLTPGRNIGGVAFDGSADINLAGVNVQGNQDTSGNAATATALANTVTIAGNNFDGTANVTIAPGDLTGTNNTLTGADLNQLDSNTLSNNVTDWTGTTTFPSSAQVDARITARIDPIDGFVAIADEDSFPTTAPPEGTAVSISNAGGMVIGASASTTDASRAGGSDTVTIQNIPANMQSQTVQDGIGMIVIATSTAHTYDFHRVIATNADVIALSDDINDFNNRYRVGSSNPTTDNDEGDLFYNTGSDKMLVWDGSEWDEVQSIGEYFIIPSSELADFANGSASIEVISNAPANASQIILSINGVIQEPNSGSSAPTDGFALDGSTIRLSATPPNPSEVWGVIIGSTVNIGEPSANTVSTAKIQDDAVTYAKMQNVSATDRLLGRDTAGAGIIEEITPANVRTMLNVADGANNYTHPNHSGEVTSTADGATVIADNVVDEANLKVSNAPTNGYVLTARSGNTGGMTWEEASAAGGATGGGSDEIFIENGQTVTTNYIVGTTLGATGACNAMSTGPITVNSGVTVTVNSGSRWVII